MAKVFTFEDIIQCPNCYNYDKLENHFAFWWTDEGIEIELWNRQIELLNELEKLGYMIVTCPKCKTSFIIKAKEI